MLQRTEANNRASHPKGKVTGQVVFIVKNLLTTGENHAHIQFNKKNGSTSCIDIHQSQWKHLEPILGAVAEEIKHGVTELNVFCADPVKVTVVRHNYGCHINIIFTLDHQINLMEGDFLILNDIKKHIDLLMNCIGNELDTIGTVIASINTV